MNVKSLLSLFATSMLLTACFSPPQFTPEEIACYKAHDEQMNLQYRDTLLAKGFTDGDAPTLSADERHAIAIAKEVVSNTPGQYYLYKVARTSDGWSVMAFPCGGHNSDGWPTVPTTGSQVYVSISADWQTIKVTGGA